MKRTTLFLCIMAAISANCFAQGNIAFQRAVYQSSSADDDKCGHLITDGSDQTYWQAGERGVSWVYVDLGAMCDVTGFGINWGANGSGCYKIEVSVQDARPDQWQQVYACTGGRGETDGIKLDKPAKARFVRLYIQEKNNASTGVSIKEFEVLGVNPYPVKKPLTDLAKGDWRIQSTLFAKEGGKEISSHGYDDSQWVSARVPGTVMGSYVAAGALPDPYYGDQMSMISEEFFSRGSFWYRTSFSTPGTGAGDRVRLDFSGINWRSEVFVNGVSVGEADGAFIRNSFDVTPLLNRNGPNYVAVHIKRLDYPGPSPSVEAWSGRARLTGKKVTHKYLGAPTFNGDILGYDSPTFLASAGWNWLPIVRGRELGIWNHAAVTVDKGVRVEDPWFETRLNLPDTTKASLTFRARLANDRNESVDGVLKIKIGSVEISRRETLPAMGSKDIVLTKEDYPQLEISSPRLWWPNGYGPQNLYTAETSFELDGAASDVKRFTVGIRDLECRVQDSILYVYVNGYRLLLRGGNWGMAEGMLNCDREGYDLRVRLHKEANFNMIRNWVGQTGHREFYDACDKYGILVFDDFWLANPVDGPAPLDFRMFLLNAEDKIKWVRSHPSLAFYCGRNEGYPPKGLDEGMRELVKLHDPSRHYEPNSAGGNLTGLGPYEQQEIKWYFANRGVTFHSELGIIAIPEAESIREMMPGEYWWPINDMWAVHDYQSPRSQNYSKLINRKYGFVNSLDQYARSAQMANMEISKAMFESYRSRQGSGVLLWMSQAAWPSLICQLYDHYFEMTASYFGTKRACAPVHIFYNALTNKVEAANNTIRPLDGLKYEVSVYDLDGNRAAHNSGDVSLPVGAARECLTLEVPSELAGKVYFLKLRLEKDGVTIADNFYWSEDSQGTSLALKDMPKAAPKATVNRTKAGGRDIAKVKLSNPKGVALMVRLKVSDARTGERVLPVSYSDNYISLLPGESREIELQYDSAPGMEPLLRLEGWNIEQREIRIK